MVTTNNRPPPLPRRRGSTKVQRPQGVWSVRLPDGSYLKDAEGVNESRAWDKFLHYHGDAQLLRGDTPVASRGLDSPLISRQVPTP